MQFQNVVLKLSNQSYFDNIVLNFYSKILVTNSCSKFQLHNLVLGAAMFAKGLWVMPGVHNVEEFDPDPFLELLGERGLPWVELHDVDLEL